MNELNKLAKQQPANTTMISAGHSFLIQPSTNFSKES